MKSSSARKTPGKSGESKKPKVGKLPVESTGLEPEQLKSLGWEWNCSRLIKPPRWQNGYERMTVDDIYWRIRLDVSELIARAFADFAPSWSSPLHWGNWRKHWLDSLTEEQVNELRPGLWQKMHSADGTIASSVREDLLSALQDYCHREQMDAVDALARVTIFATGELRALFEDRKEMLKKVANSFEVWPVNLGVQARCSAKATGGIASTITGFEDAQDYLLQAGVNGGKAGKSVAKKTGDERLLSRSLAYAVYQALLWIRRDIGRFFPKRLSHWARKLMCLSVPIMRGDSADQWWRVAKVFIAELWEHERQFFGPLLAHLRLGDDKDFIQRKRVFDQVKRAFTHLAVVS